MKKSPKFSPEVRERAVHMVLEHRAEHPSQWAAIEACSTKLLERLKFTYVQGPALAPATRVKLSVA